MNLKRVFPLIILLSFVSGCTGTRTPSSSGSDTPVIQGKSLIPEIGEYRLLFSPGPIGETRIYNYCPTIFIEDGVQHVYYCTNQTEGNVTDYVGYRRGTIQGEHISYSENEFVLAHGEAGSWDYRHACDPSVIKGEFKFHGETYNYLMAYLGCVPSDCTQNETGIAVAKSPAGPWVKCDFKEDGVTKINPIVPFSDFACSETSWGTGQPSIVSVDKKGKVLFFTTVGATNGTFTNIREYDFSDIDNYELIRSRTKIIEAGVRANTTGASFINNADFAYDEVARRFLMVKGRLYFGKDNLAPDMVADTLDVYYIDDTEGTDVGDIFFAGNNTTKQWKLIDTINQEKTGFLRNHNSCLITDPYGHHIQGQGKLGVGFTRSDQGVSNNWSYLSTYRIYATSVAYNNE